MPFGDMSFFNLGVILFWKSLVTKTKRAPIDEASDAEAVDRSHDRLRRHVPTD